MAQNITSIEVLANENPNSFNYKIKSDGGEPCGAVLCFGDGKCDSIEIKENGVTMLNNTYKQPGDYPVYIYGANYSSFFKELNACENWPHTVNWIVRNVDSYKDELDILLLANPKFISKNLDGTIRFFPKEAYGTSNRSFDCGNVSMISDFKRDPLNYELDEVFYKNKYRPLIFNASLYKKIGIDNVDKIGFAEIDKFLASHGFIKPREQRFCPNELMFSPSALTYSSIVAIPRAFLSQYAQIKKEWGVIADWPVVGTLTKDELLKHSRSLKASENQAKEYSEKLKYQYTQNQKANPKSQVGSLIFGIENNPKLNYLDTHICTVKGSVEDDAALRGYRLVGNEILLPEHKKLLLKYGLSLQDGKSKYPNFYHVYENLNEVFLGISERKSTCFVYVDYIENIYSLYEAIRRDKLTENITFGLIRNAQSMRDQTAKSYEFESWEQKTFADKIGANQYQVKQLKSERISTSEEYESLLKEIAESGYSKSKTLQEIFDYLEDRREGKTNNLSAVDQRNFRLKEQNKARERYLAEQSKIRLERSKEFPYEAILFCSLNGNKFDLVACMNSRNGGELEIRNGSQYGLYSAWDLYKLGKSEQGVGLVIPLRRNFSIRARNSSDDLILTFRLIDTASQKEIFTKSVSTYGTIRFEK